MRQPGTPLPRHRRPQFPAPSARRHPPEVSQQSHRRAQLLTVGLTVQQLPCYLRRLRIQPRPHVGTRTLRMILDSLKSGTVCMPVPSTSQTSACKNIHPHQCCCRCLTEAEYCSHIYSSGAHAQRCADLAAKSSLDLASPKLARDACSDETTTSTVRHGCLASQCRLDCSGKRAAAEARRSSRRLWFTAPDCSWHGPHVAQPGSTHTKPSRLLTKRKPRLHQQPLGRHGTEAEQSAQGLWITSP